MTNYNIIEFLDFKYPSSEELDQEYKESLSDILEQDFNINETYNELGGCDGL